MDLLGSILDSMEKPPQTSSKQEILIKSLLWTLKKIMKSSFLLNSFFLEQQETLKKINEMEKEKLKKISSNVCINSQYAMKVNFD